ncbi:MAG: hypothetical protein ACFE7R_08270 [Candidatus Hodarchaeota archaeon]
MTGQIPDSFKYDGLEFSLVGMKGDGLYTPHDFRLTPRMASTACWRGYIMTYDCVDGQLVLSSMSIRTYDSPSEINGIEPKTDTEKYRMFTHHYENLNLKTRFTGSMLLGRDFIQGMYVHMGFQRPIAFRTVLEIHVQDGDIICVNDLSEKMEELRNQNRERDAEPSSLAQKDVYEWIEQTFSLDYDL